MCAASFRPARNRTRLAGKCQLTLLSHSQKFGAICRASLASGTHAGQLEAIAGKTSHDGSARHSRVQISRATG
jgi:hypothetical protein